MWIISRNSNDACGCVKNNQLSAPEIISDPCIAPFPILQDLQYLQKPKAIDVLHLESIHPVISGNKWYKLKYNIKAAQAQGYDSLLSCGGAHSNHLHALACAGKVLGMKTVAFVRGYEELPLTPTLLDCQQMGMTLIFVDKKTYKQRYDQQWCQQQSEQYDSYWIPEGGNNDFGHQGCAELAKYCQGYDEIWLSIGSGATFLGLAEGVNTLESSNLESSNKNVSQSPQIHGVLAIKGGEALASDLLSCVGQAHSIDTEGHLGGFGKCPDALIARIKAYDAHGLALDPVYTGKLIVAFEQSWQADLLDASKRYLIIHSGGLQGRRGVAELVTKV